MTFPPIFRRLSMLACVGMGLSVAALASEPSADAASVLAGPCANCHAPGGASAIPALRGMPEAQLRARLLAFHEGRVSDATVMTRLMKGYDRGQIEALAKWFAAEARP